MNREKCSVGEGEGREDGVVSHLFSTGASRKILLAVKISSCKVLVVLFDISQFP